MSIIHFYSEVKDTVTQFKGFVTSRAEHLNGCIRYLVQPPVDKEKQLPKGYFIDSQTLKIVAPPKAGLPPAIKTPDVFKLGVTVENPVTGFKGVVVVRVKYPYAGDRYYVQGLVDEKGNIPEPVDFDEAELKQIDPPPSLKKDEKKKPKPPAGPHGYSTTITR